MPTVYQCSIAHGSDALKTPLHRYALIRRLAASARSHDVLVLAFGLGAQELRLVLEGDAVAQANVVRGTKAGTCRVSRSVGRPLVWGDTVCDDIAEAELTSAVAWCHDVDGDADPLQNAWTSHRDLMGFRQSDFYDPAVLGDRVDPQDVHARAGGGSLPSGRVTEDGSGLDHMMRVSAAVLGVLPADRRCFRLFVHLARERGWQTAELARALMLTGRRIRQLAQGDEPLLDVAQAHLADRRLAHVP
ncbi:MAG: hypothetical protein H6733_15375 [Alphaproteobacteria bacterium]|nr:hypothetical protein [Alphaproteobacteria bacterium]